MLDLDVEVKQGATLLMTTQSATKAFRGETRQVVRARVEGTLVAWPDPVACFGGATYGSEVRVTLGGSGALVLVDAFTSGRPAYGERWAFERFSTRVRVERVQKDERCEPVAIDAALLDAQHGAIGERFGRVNAFATVFAVGAGVRPVIEALLEVGREEREQGVLYAPSRLARDEGAVARVAGERTEDVLRTVHRRLRNVAEMCGVDPYRAKP
ncbi:urease accessory protein UreD [Pendulispora albinea]|uniref:Urease accessory protein UreD n=1 Tax=Pendulispora albinea TaxID=2741071 RepID=A0ABZ2LRF6_9BACT